MIEYGEKHPYSLLCADPRLGKTRSAISLQAKRKANCLVVCPAHLVTNWKREILKWQPKSQVTMFRKGKEIYDVCDADFVVTSYDLIQKAEHLFEWADMVVADEIHHLKSMDAKKSQFFHRCLFENSIKFFHGLTGTPIKNRVKEFYSLIALTYYDPRLEDGYAVKKSDDFKEFLRLNATSIFQQKFLDIFPDEITFAEHFSFSESYEIDLPYGRQTITRYFGLKNETELREWLKNRYIRIKADKNDLPPMSYLDTLVSDIADPKLLKAFTDYFVADAVARRMGLSHHATRKIRTSSVLPEHKCEAAIKKAPFTIKYVEDLMESVDCCLVYSDHRAPVEQIAKHFGVPAITGSMPATKRAQLVNDFQAGKLNILCATIGSLKEGADLFRAKDLILNDPSWVPGDILQVVNRTRALGEKEPRTIHRIFGSPQDEKIWEALEDKMETIRRAT